MKEASVSRMISVDGVAFPPALRNTRARVRKLVAIPAFLPAGSAWRLAPLGDLAGLAAALALTSLWLTPAAAVRAWTALPLWLAVFAAFGLYDRRRLTAASSEALRLVKGVSICVAGTGLFVLPGPPRLWLGALWAASVLASGTPRGILRMARSRRPLGVLVVGTNEQAQAIGSALARGRWSGYRALGFVRPGRDATGRVDGLPVVGGTDRLARTIVETGAHAVVIVAGALPASTARKIHEQVRASGLECWTTALPSRLATRRMRLDDLDGNPVLAVHGSGGARRREAGKRALDIIGSATALLLGAPLFAAIAVAIKANDPTGPVFFRQTRVGKDRKRFRLVKFRTMVDRAEERLEEVRQTNEADGLLFKIRDDPRVTRVGRFLRRTSLDELPQLWNVLRGDMSLVGPRPALSEETDRYEGRLRGRLCVKPGMTGLWQVNGRQDLTWADYVHYDLFYAENWSMALDVAVLARTLPAVVRGRGAW